MYVFPYSRVHLPDRWMGPAMLATAASAAILLSLRAHFRGRLTQGEREARRRGHLAEHGRIVDGSIVHVDPSEHKPETIVYRYEIAGVTYECSQDVSAMDTRIENVHLAFPVQVRYNRANPGDSIVVAESWNGLWNSLWTLPVEVRPAEATEFTHSEVD